MATATDLLRAIDGTFADMARDVPMWADPHPDRMPADGEYSRLTNPAKWRIVGARADAWATALVELGVASIDLEVGVEWMDPPRMVVSRLDRVVPVATGAVPLVLARSRLGDVDDAGVVVGVGDPAVIVTWIPDCGCDACDSGSQDVIDELDDYLWSIVRGTFRLLYDGDRRAMVLDGFRRRWENLDDAEAMNALADPTGWHQVAGAPWIGDAPEPYGGRHARLRDSRRHLARRVGRARGSRRPGGGWRSDRRGR